MADFRVITDGFDRASREIAEQARRNTQTFGRMIVEQYEQEVKTEAPWTDRRGQARRGIGGEMSASGDKVTLRLGASAPNYKKGPRSVQDYMEVLEFGMDERFQVVYPVFMSLTKDIRAQFGNAALTGAFVKIKRDKAWSRRRSKAWRAKQR